MDEFMYGFLTGSVVVGFLLLRYHRKLDRIIIALDVLKGKKKEE